MTSEIMNTLKDIYINDTFITPEYHSRHKFPIAAPQSESHKDSLAAQKPIDWDIDKLSKLASILPKKSHRISYRTGHY